MKQQRRCKQRFEWNELCIFSELGLEYDHKSKATKLRRICTCTQNCSGCKESYRNELWLRIGGNNNGN